MNSTLRRRGSVLAILSALLLALPAGAAPKPGATAPAFSAKTPGGKTLRLRDLRGKVVLLDFWMPECPPCVLAMPALQKLQDKYRDRNLVVLGVAQKVSDLAVATRFRKRLGVTYPYVIDKGSRIYDQYGLNTHPTTLLIDSKGVVRQVGEGFLKGDEKEIEAALIPLLPPARGGKR